MPPTATPPAKSPKPATPAPPPVDTPKPATSAVDNPRMHARISAAIGEVRGDPPPAKEPAPAPDQPTPPEQITPPEPKTPTPPPQPNPDEPKTEPEPESQPDAAAKSDAGKRQAKGVPEFDDNTPIAEQIERVDKLGPWQQRHWYKDKFLKRDAEVDRLMNELRQSKDTSSITAEQARANAAEARLRELEQVVNETAYERSTEFKSTYEAPLREAWERAASDLSQLIVDEDGVQRKASLADMTRLVNLPLQAAHSAAKELFGDLSGDIMAHRRAILERNQSMEKALKTAQNRSEEARQLSESKSRALKEENQRLWQAANDEDKSKQPHLQEIDGDEEWNSRLAESAAFVDGTYSRNPDAPGVSAEERADLIRRRAAIRGRAIGYGPLKLELARVRSQLAESNAKIEAYENGEPGQSVTPAAPEPGSAPVHASAKDRLNASISEYFKTGILPPLR